MNYGKETFCNVPNRKNMIGCPIEKDRRRKR
jgi:hypothetical protein